MLSHSLFSEKTAEQLQPESRFQMEILADFNKNATVPCLILRLVTKVSCHPLHRSDGVSADPKKRLAQECFSCWCGGVCFLLAMALSSLVQFRLFWWAFQPGSFVLSSATHIKTSDWLSQACRHSIKSKTPLTGWGLKVGGREAYLHFNVAISQIWLRFDQCFNVMICWNSLYQHAAKVFTKKTYLRVQVLFNAFPWYPGAHHWQLDPVVL